MNEKLAKDNPSPSEGVRPSTGMEGVPMTQEQKWQSVMETVTTHVREKHCHLKPRFGLIDLSLETFLPQYFVSKAINRTNGESFSVWMNRFRIEHFLDPLKREGTGEYGIHVLAMRSGFLSKASFIKAFRKEMGMNPGAFAKSLTSGKDITGGGSTGS
jgi:AraC-like DNA-binding protein